MKQIRIAEGKDAAGILKIYAPYILNTSLTFETEVPEVNAFKERIKSYLINWPWLVCEINGEVTGYAYASRYRERAGYQWCVEVSVYIPDKYQRSGIAKALYTALLEILKKQGFRNAYAVINLPNDRSVSFHERLGFTYFAAYDNVGYKLGNWKKVGWWMLQLNDYSKEPHPPIKFRDLDRKFLSNIFPDAEKLIVLK